MDSIFIIYSSPAGSTARLAERISQFFLRFAERNNAKPLIHSIDLGSYKFYGEPEKLEDLYTQIKNAGSKGLLFVGSPVYVGHIVPPITAFLRGLPQNTDAAVVPFITWGEVSSGVALYEAAEIAASKGYRVVGGLSMAAEHSQTWMAEQPLGENRPNETDLQDVDNFLNQLIKRLEQSEDASGFQVPATPELSLLKHPDHSVVQKFQQLNLAQAASHMPQRKVRTEGPKACIRCGKCAEVCPTGAIEFEPFPVFTERCIFCFNCVRHCPSASIEVDLASKVDWLHSEAARQGEVSEPHYMLLI